jgi:hypothetical protein
MPASPICTPIFVTSLYTHLLLPFCRDAVVDVVGIRCLRLRHIAHARRRATDCHACLQVVDQVADERYEDEEDEDDEEDDDVALHGCGEGGGGVRRSSVGLFEAVVI